jgi:hypothetical protein
MAMKKKPNAAGVLTAGKKGNTKNTKVKAKPNAGLLAGYRRLEAACAFLEKKTQKAFVEFKKVSGPYMMATNPEARSKHKEFLETYEKLFLLQKAKTFCDSVCKFGGKN